MTRIDSIARLRVRARAHIEKYPWLRSVVDQALYIDFALWRLKVEARDYGEGFDASKVCWISPRVIRYVSLKSFNPYGDEGRFVRVARGSWDSLQIEIEDSSEYRGMKREIARKEDKENSTSDRISNVMFKSKTESESDLIHEAEDEITVNIGRDGDLLLNTGIGALAAAKLLNVKQVPVRIIARHSRWQKFRKEILSLSLEKRLYQPMTHPDLRKGTSAEHRCEDRFDMIKENLSVQRGKLLDIGANFGYFCHKFEDLDFECIAVESDLRALYFLKKLKRAENRSFKIVTQSILEWEGVKRLRFDVVLALNIFHHFLKSEETYPKFMNLLKNLKAREMFLEPPFYNEVENNKHSGRRFADFILRNSQFRTAKLIGVAHDGRSLYKLT